MAKRKAQSSSDNDEVRSSKKPNNSINQSYIETANLMSKIKLFRKGTTDTLMSQIKVENTSESESEAVSQKSKTQSKVKSKHKVTIRNSDSDNERESTIALLLNETKDIVLKKKSKKSQKRKSLDKLSNSFSPNILPTIKNEYEEENDIDANEVNNVDSDQKLLNGNSNEISSILQQHEDEKIVKSVENKIHLLQDIRIVPVKTKSPQKQLHDLYPNLTMIDIATKMKVKEPVDVYLLRVPKSINPQSILNLEISLEETCKIKADGERFVIRPTSKIPDSTLMLGNKTEILNFKRNLVMEKYIKANKGPTIPTTETSFILPPNNLKNRHPLFGSNFEDKIQLDEAIEKRLDEAIKNLLKPSKSKKNKKVGKHRMSVGHSTLLPDISTSDRFNLNISSISPRKNSKKKKSLESNTLANDDFSFIADLFKTAETKRKPKTSKMNEECDENGDASTSYQPNAKDLSSERKTKKRKIKEEPTDTSPMKKKKKIK